MGDLEKEAELLKQANDQLRLELASLKERVESLREQRNNDEDVGEEAHLAREDVLLALENQLLRAQLREQQEFLEGCRNLMLQQKQLVETPLLSIPMATHASKSALMNQGAENALTQLFLLVSRCQGGENFESVTLPPHCFQSAVPGLTVTCCFRKEGNQFTFRVDGCFPNIAPETVSAGYWSTWTNADSYASTFEGFFDSPAIQPNRTPVPFEMQELLSERFGAHNWEETRVNLYREYPSNTSAPKDWIHCLTKVKREVALSTLSMPAEFNPSVTSRRDQHSRRLAPTSTRVRKRAKGSSSASTLRGRQECIVLARSALRGWTEKTEAAPTTTNNNVITDSAQEGHFEGLISFQDEVSLDCQVEGPEGKEILRKRVPATRSCMFLSFPSNITYMQDTELLPAIVDASGKATERFAKLIDAYYVLMGSSM